jgi:hypothetical protein
MHCIEGSNVLSNLVEQLVEADLRVARPFSLQMLNLRPFNSRFGCRIVSIGEYHDKMKWVKWERAHFIAFQNPKKKTCINLPLRK